MVRASFVVVITGAARLLAALFDLAQENGLGPTTHTIRFGLERDLLAFVQCLEPAALNSGNMDEDVALATIRHDEAEALVTIEELHGTGLPWPAFGPRTVAARRTVAIAPALPVTVAAATLPVTVAALAIAKAPTALPVAVASAALPVAVAALAISIAASLAVTAAAISAASVISAKALAIAKLIWPARLVATAEIIPAAAPLAAVAAPTAVIKIVTVASPTVSIVPITSHYSAHSPPCRLKADTVRIPYPRPTRHRCRELGRMPCWDL